MCQVGSARVVLRKRTARLDCAVPRRLFLANRDSPPSPPPLIILFLVIRSGGDVVTLFVMAVMCCAGPLLHTDFMAPASLSGMWPMRLFSTVVYFIEAHGNDSELRVLDSELRVLCAQCTRLGPLHRHGFVEP